MAITYRCWKASFIISLLTGLASACVKSRSPPEWEMFRDYSDYDNYDVELGPSFEGAFQTVGTTTQAVSVSPGRYCGRNEYRWYGTVPPMPGNDAAEDEMPWHVQLVLNTNTSPTGRNSFCSAVVINERWLLTSASCASKVKNVAGASMTAYFGNNQRQGNAFFTSGVTTIILHPKYNAATYEYDVALLQLQTQITSGFPNWEIQRICLPDTCEQSCYNNVSSTSGTLVTSGWGQSIDATVNTPLNNLQKFQINAVSMDTCQSSAPLKPNEVAFSSIVSTSMMCAGTDDTTGLCQGDTGGPVMCFNSEGNYELAGITLFAQNCPRAQRYGTFTKLCDKDYDEILDGFIKQNI